MRDPKLSSWNSSIDIDAAQARLCPTYAGRASFRVAGSVADGAAIWPGKAGSPLRFSGDFFARLLARFAGLEIEVGGSFGGPSPNSLGEYIQNNLPTRMNPAVYLAGLLIEEGYAERTGRGRLRFFSERDPSASRPLGGSAMPQLNRRLLQKIEQLNEDEARDVLRYIEEKITDSKQREILKTLKDNPAFSISERRLGRFERLRARTFSGKPLSEIVIEERR